LKRLGGVEDKRSGTRLKKPPSAKRRPHRKMLDGSREPALRQQLDQRNRELRELQEQQAATSKVLEVISSSRGDLAPVFWVVLENAVPFCGAKFGNLWLREGDSFDEPDVEMLFRQHFRRDLRAGRFTMEFAQSAPVALQSISNASDASLILILSDINMPGMSGLELLPKAKEARPDVPVIMITAYGDVETKRKALENGADALLTKSIDFVLLRNEIDTRIERAA
jgi:CheY-like chemotaxis protein